MKRLLLPKNKFTRLAINIIFIRIWHYLSTNFLFGFYINTINFLDCLSPFSDCTSPLDFVETLGCLMIEVFGYLIIIRIIWFSKKRKED